MDRHTRQKRLFWFGLGVFIVFALLAALIWLPYNQAYALVHPYILPVSCSPEEVAGDYRSVSFLSPDGLVLRGWYFPPHNGAVVVFVHGLGANRCDFIREAGILSKQGYGTLLFDLHNHGESDPGLTTLGLTEKGDVAAAVAFVRAQEGVEHIALWGHSMGAATVLLASPDLPEVEAVISASSYTSVADNVQDSLTALTGLPPELFAPLVIFWGERIAHANISEVRPVDAIGRISPRPILILHGDQDELIPVRNAQLLYEAANEPKQLYLVAGAGHNGFLDADPVEYPRRVLEFLNSSLHIP